MERPLNILILEDRREDFELINKALLRDGLSFKSFCVDSEQEFIEALHNFKPDIVLSDHALPQFNSIEALKLCQGAGAEIPFILVTGTVSEEFAVTALKQGADDYILKSNLSRLSNAIVNSLKKRELEKQRNHAERDLRQQNEKLLKINKELDSFVYSVSHDIRSPLMSVLGLVDLLEHDGGKVVSKEELLNMMRTSIHKLDDTLMEIIDYSKNARYEVAKTKIDLRALLDDCMENLKYMPGASNLTKEITINDSIPFFSDPYRLKVVFNNLISNAVKYSDTRRKNQFLKIFIDVKEDTAVMLFEDNGIGIEPQHVGKIFNMFFRATTQREGSGLGLYIVKEAVEKMGGKISVESAQNIGTQFRVQVPNYKV